MKTESEIRKMLRAKKQLLKLREESRFGDSVDAVTNIQMKGKIEALQWVLGQSKRDRL